MLDTKTKHVMKQIYKYLLLTVAIAFMGSRKKDESNKLTQNSPTKLSYTEGVFTVLDMKKDTLSGIPVENDTLILNYYNYTIRMIYRLKQDLISGRLDTFKVDENKFKNYNINRHNGNIMIKKNIFSIEDEYFAFVSVASSTGAVDFPQAWKFKVGDKTEIINDMVYKPATLDTLKSKIIGDIVSATPRLYGDFELAENPFSFASVKLDNKEISDYPFIIDPSTAVINVTADEAKKLAYGKYSFAVTVAGDKDYENVWNLVISVESGGLKYEPNKVSLEKNTITADIVSATPKYDEGEYPSITNPYSIVSVTKDETDLVDADNPFTIDATTGIITITKDKASALDAATYAITVGVATDDGIQEHKEAWTLILADAPIVKSIIYDPATSDVTDGSTAKKVFASVAPVITGLDFKFSPPAGSKNVVNAMITHKVKIDGANFDDDNGVFFVDRDKEHIGGTFGTIKVRIDPGKSRSLAPGKYVVSLEVTEVDDTITPFADVYTFIVLK